VVNHLELLYTRQKTREFSIGFSICSDRVVFFIILH